MTDDEIRLFNEIMQNQSGEQAEGLATRYPGVFEVPRIGDIPDPLNMRKRMEDSERRRKEAEEAAFQEQYGQKTILDMARPEFIPDDITQAINAIRTVGSGAGAGIKAMLGKAFGMDPEAIMERNIYFPETVKKAQRGEPLTDEERRDLAFYGRYAGKIGEGIEKAEDVLAPVVRAYDASKLDALMFMPGTRNISMIDDIIEEGIGAARRAAPAAKMASEAAQMTAQQTADYVKELGATFDQLKPIVNLPNIQKMIREEFESPPIGAIAPDALGFSSRLSESVDKLQDKGTGPQFLAQLKKMKGVPQKEIEATGLDKYLQGAGKVTKEDVQDFLSTNRLQLIEDERMTGAGRLDKEVIQYLPRQFDWLDMHDLDEEFIDKAHLRNHLVRTLDKHFDDLEAEASNTGSFYARDSSTGDLRYIPASKRFEWRESEIDKIDNELEDLPDFNGATKYPDEYQIPGGENYREILYKLPDDKVEGVFRPPPSHFDNAENTFGSIRATDRDIDGKPVLFAEEIQSDWSIKGSQGGYLTPEKLEEKNKLAKQLDALGDEYSKLLKVVKEKSNTDPEIAKALEPKMQELVRETTKTKNEYNRILREVAPDNPFRGNWYKPVVNNFLVKAAKEGKQGIGFPTGQIIADRYNLSKAVDAIEWNTYAYKSGNKYKTIVFRNFGDQGVIEVDVNPETGVIKEISSDLDMTPDWEGKNIVDVVGKGVAEKIMKDKSGLLDEEGLKIGGKGKDKLYDEMIPKQLKEIGDKYGVQLEKRTIPFGEGDRTESEVYFFPITEEMRADLLNQGLPMFKQGGHVQKYSKGGKVLEGIAKGAKQAVKNISKKDLQAIGSELETSTGRLAEIAKKYPQIKDISVSEMEQFSAGDPFTTYRGISLFPGAELRPEVIPSTTIEPGIATNILRDAPVIMGRQDFVSPKGVLRQYPGVRPLDVEVYVPSMIESITERQPGALELKIPTRSGGKMSLKDVFDEVRQEKEVLADVSGKQPIDIMFDKYGGGMMDRMFMNVARDVFSGKWEGGEKFLKEMGGYYTDPQGMIKEFDEFAASIAPVKKSKGGALSSVMKGTKEATDQVAKAQKMLQGVYRGYTGERLAEPVLSTTPQKRVAEYYANRRAAERGEDPHLEMLMVDPFAGKQYGLSLPIDQYNRDFITTRARAITPEDVAERIQLKKRGGLASLSR
jgi:hypothetical protein